MACESLANFKLEIKFSSKIFDLKRLEAPDSDIKPS